MDNLFDSSEADFFLFVVREVRKRNCLSKHECKFDIVMAIILWTPSEIEHEHFCKQIFPLMSIYIFLMLFGSIIETNLFEWVMLIISKPPGS